MKIRHRLTKDERELDFHTWTHTISNKDSYEIIDRGDTVYVRQILKDGSRRYLYELDRNHATRIVSKHPQEYDWQELPDLPVAVKSKLILNELKSTESWQGELSLIMDSLKLPIRKGTLKEFASFFEENQYARCAISKDGCFLTLTEKGKDYLSESIETSTPQTLQADHPAITPQPKITTNSKKKSTKKWNDAPSRRLQVLSIIVIIIIAIITYLTNKGII